MQRGKLEAEQNLAQGVAKAGMDELLYDDRRVDVAPAKMKLGQVTEGRSKAYLRRACCRHADE